VFAQFFGRAQQQAGATRLPQGSGDGGKPFDRGGDLASVAELRLHLKALARIGGGSRVVAPFGRHQPKIVVQQRDMRPIAQGASQLILRHVPLIDQHARPRSSSGR
jgi:hypothetical protein